jgi:hypothetical protein
MANFQFGFWIFVTEISIKAEVENYFTVFGLVFLLLPGKELTNPSYGWHQAKCKSITQHQKHKKAWDSLYTATIGVPRLTAFEIEDITF